MYYQRSNRDLTQPEKQEVYFFKLLSFFFCVKLFDCAPGKKKKNVLFFPFRVSRNEFLTIALSLLPSPAQQL